MHPAIQIRNHILRGCGVVAIWLLGQTGAAGLIVNLSSTPMGGGIHQYDITVINNSAVDVPIVSITDAPVNDPLIAATLVSPTGMTAHYDAGIGLTFGFVDLLEDTVLFGAGQTVSGFQFQSKASQPNFFNLFEALTTGGDFLSGRINLVAGAVPDSGYALGMVGLCFFGLIWAHRKSATHYVPNY